LDYVIKEAEKKRRQPAPPAPIGGISQSAASRKFGVPQRTISRWVQSGDIPVLKRTNREVYIDETICKKKAEIYLKNPGQGKRSASKE
jgi:hypothetical protein